MRPPEPSVAAIAARLGVLRARLDELGGSAVEVVAVTKAFPAQVIAAAVEAGCTSIGENYAQELVGKRPVLDSLSERRPEVHFVGHLQSNKVRSLAGVVDVWQTLDRRSLADELAVRLPGAKVMVQVNTTGEEAKSGCRPQDTEELVGHAAQLGLDVSGLMTIGPTDGEQAATRDAFRMLRALADRLALGACSMGMTGDYELAVAEGSTHVRIGTLLFGPRPRRR